nr:M56 family metallopeptidase [Christiangramia gaetbulicola]
MLILFSFYKLFLENENFHKIKRFYLLLALLISFVLPLITFTYEVEVPLTPSAEGFQTLEISPQEPETTLINWQFVLYVVMGIYLAGFIFFSIRFFRNLRSLLKEASSNERLTEFNYIYILLGKKLDPHSFFNYIFLNKTEFINDKISKAVIEHEKAHVDQKHSLDLVLIEVLQIIFWFNPLFYWIKRSIKLNHEFLADREVLSKDFNALEYSNILFNYSSGYHHNSLSSPINHSLIKKRIIMITKDFSIKKLLTRAGLFLPVLGCCIFFFNNEIVAKTVYTTNNPEITELPFAQEKNPVEDIDKLVLQQPDLKIRIEGEKVWVNGKSVKPESFAAEIDALTSKLKEEELEDISIHMKTKNVNDGFMENLNKEFAKTRLAKITGRSILPPPPPLPPSPEAVREIPSPPPPPAPPHPKHEQIIEEGPDSSERMEMRHREHSARIEAERARLEREKEILRSEKIRIREMERKLQEDQRLSEAEKERLLRDQAREIERMEKIGLRMEKRQIELEKRQEEMERRQKEAQKRQQKTSSESSPAVKGNSQVLSENVKNEHGLVVKTVVSKENSIEKYSRDAVYYLNDEQISYQKAMKIIKEGSAKQVDIRKISENIDAVKIYI